MILQSLPLIALLLLDGAPAAPEPTHAEEVDAWHQWRIDRLHSPDGYLTLVGLFRLDEGANSFGSAEDNLLRFPARAPAHAGTLHVERTEVRLEVAAGVEMTVDDAPFGGGLLGTDQDEETTVVGLGSLRFYVIERPGLLLLRLRDHEAPLLSTFEGIERFPIDPSWRVTARLEPYPEPKAVSIANVVGTSEVESVPAALVFERAGKTYRLDPIPSEDRYWVIYGDATNGAETYGAGRYVYTEDAAEDGTVVIDFNKSYNPPCVFTDFATCPLPPPGNVLKDPVWAGEKMWDGVQVK